MLRQIKRYLGVTLIEMMLVLIIMSLIAVSVIEFANRQRDQAASQALGEKLYVYGQAVRAYLLDNQADIRGNPQGSISGQSPASGRYTFVGVDWLKNPPIGTANPNPQPNANPYLEDNFTFNTGMHPLFVGPVRDASDVAITTEVEFGTPGDRTSPLVVTITMPGLFKEVNGAVVPMPDISVGAADFANKFYNSVAGGAAFFYEYQLPADGNFAASFIVGELRDISEQEDYLRVDGQNFMRQSIVLAEPDNPDEVPFAAPTDAGARNIMGVERIYFDATDEGVPTGITDIDAILFNNTNNNMLKTIEGLNSLEFSDTAASSITSLDTIQFTGVTSTITGLQVMSMVPVTTTATANQLGAIVNVNQLNFAGNAGSTPKIRFTNFPGTITNVEYLAFSTGGGMLLGDGKRLNRLQLSSQYTGDTSMTPSDRSICFLVDMRVGTMPAECEVAGVSGVWMLRKTGSSNECAARCLTFSN